MEKRLDLHDLFRVSILEGTSHVPYEDNFLEDILSNKDNRRSEDNENTFYEDTVLTMSSTLHAIISEITEAYRYVYKHRLVLVDMWSHIQYPGQSCNRHGHAPQGVSAVYYVKVPEGAGSLTFHTPCNPWEHGGETEYVVKPKPRHYVIFPGWLPHSVKRNASEDTRISLSFNFNIAQ